MGVYGWIDKNVFNGNLPGGYEKPPKDNARDLSNQTQEETNAMAESLRDNNPADNNPNNDYRKRLDSSNIVDNEPTDTVTYSSTGQKIVETPIMEIKSNTLNTLNNNNARDLSGISQQQQNLYLDQMAANNRGEVYQVPIKEAIKPKTGYYFNQEGFKTGFVTSDGQFFPTNDENFVPDGYVYEEPTEKAVYDPKTGDISYVESKEFGMSMTGDEYQKKIDELTAQIKAEDLKLENAEKYGTSFGGGGNFNKPSYEEPEDLSFIEKIKTGGLGMAGLALGTAESFNPLGQYSEKKVTNTPYNSANVFNIGYTTGYEASYKENEKLAEGKRKFIEWAAPSASKLMMNDAGPSTKVVEATQRNINLAVANRGDIKTWQSKDTGAIKQASAGFTDLFFPTSFASAGKTSLMVAGLAGASYVAPIAVEFIGTGLGLIGSYNYFTSKPFDPNKKYYAMDILDLVTLPAVAPRLYGEFNLAKRALKSAGIFGKADDIPTTNIFVKAEKLIPPKTLSGEEAYPLDPKDTHYNLFQEFSQRLPGKRPIVPKDIITSDYAKYNIYSQIRDGKLSVTPSGHGYTHAEAVIQNVNKLVDAYPEYNSYWIKKYGSVTEAKAQLTNSMWHDATKIVSSSKTDEFTIFGQKHGESYYNLWRKGLLPPEANVNKNIAQAVRFHETIAGTKEGTKALSYRISELFGRNTPEMKILATADRLDLKRFGIKVDPNRLPLRDALVRVNYNTNNIIPIKKYTPEMDLFIKDFEKKYVVSFDTGEVMPRTTAPPVGYHASGDIFNWNKGITDIKPSKSEIPGLYVAPWLSPKFLKIGSDAKRYSLLPNFDNIMKGWTPSVLEITPKRFDVVQGIKVPEYDLGGVKYTQIIPGKKELGVIEVPMIKTEVEGVLATTLQAPGQGLQLTSQYGYTRYPTTSGNVVVDFLQGKGRFGRVVLIDTAKTVDTGLLGKAGSSVNGFTGKSSYRLPDYEDIVIPISPAIKNPTKTTSEIDNIESYSNKVNRIVPIISGYIPTISRSSVISYNRKPVTTYKPVIPYKPVANYNPITPYKPVAPYKPFVPYKPITPYKERTQYKPIALYKPASISYPGAGGSYNNRKKKPTRQQAFNIEIKRRGKWISQNVALTEKQAGLLAQKRLKMSLGASARLVPTEKRLQNAVVNFTPQKGEFRQYQIKGGQRIPTPRMFIQEIGGKGKSFSRLGTRKEVSEIMMVKKSKGGKIKW